jgi:hypothetical protein
MQRKEYLVGRNRARGSVKLDSNGRGTIILPGPQSASRFFLVPALVCAYSDDPGSSLSSPPVAYAFLNIVQGDTCVWIQDNQRVTYSHAPFWMEYGDQLLIRVSQTSSDADRIVGALMHYEEYEVVITERPAKPIVGPPARDSGEGGSPTAEGAENVRTPPPPPPIYPEPHRLPIPDPQDDPTYY